MKVKVFLGDLVHTWGRISVWTHPLNIGFVGSYGNAQHENRLDIKLFKRPDLLIESIRLDKPDVIALSYYVWNFYLNNLIIRIAREANPDVLMVGGGPHFTLQNKTEHDARRFFHVVPELDAFVVNQGERPFAELLGAYFDCGKDIQKLRSLKVPGCLINDLTRSDTLRMGDEMDALRDLDVVPSPYLSGMLDEFFSEPMTPIIETNRSCPFRCTFCAWGIGTVKLSKFSLERVFSEIEYISKHASGDTSLFIADANFSILERDGEIARKLRECSEQFGSPKRLNIQWNKTRPDRVLAVAKEIADLTMVGASMQTFNSKSLEVIKRKNLPIADVVSILDTLRETGSDMMLFSELILGLPEETRASHLGANKKLIDIGAQTFNYNLHLLPGTEMNSLEIRNAYFRKTGWRLHDNAYGIYDGVKVFEGQEVVQETTTMSEEDIADFRFIHFLFQFMWQYRWYYDFLMYLKVKGIHPVDFIEELAKLCRDDEDEIGSIYREFYSDYELERFKSYDDLVAYWKRDENMDRLENGDYGKLNYAYTYRILLDHQEAFSEQLLITAKLFFKDLDKEKLSETVAQLSELLRFCDDLRVNIAEDGLVESKYEAYAFDILSWRESLYSEDLSKLPNNNKIGYKFYIPPTKRNFLERRFQNFKSSNLNLTFRKLSEYTQFNMLQYGVKKLN